MKDDFLFVVVLCLLIFGQVSDIIRGKQINTINECLVDIDHRITALEQSQSVTDTALVSVLQNVNESLYEVKKIEAEILN